MKDKRLFWSSVTDPRPREMQTNITLRDIFAGLAMAGLLAAPDRSGFDSPEELATVAVRDADALLVALEAKP